MCKPCNSPIFQKAPRQSEVEEKLLTKTVRTQGCLANHRKATEIKQSSKNDTCLKHIYAVCCAQSLQSCLTLCDTMDCSPPGSSVHGTLQARILEWVALPSSRDLPDPGIEPMPPALQADSLPLSHRGSPKHIYS